MDTSFNRRDFLKATAASAAILPTFNILSQEAAKTLGPDDTPLNVAVIGFGAEGEVLYDAAVKIPGIRFRAVCDIHPERLKLGRGRMRAQGHTDVKPYEDYREMLEKEDKNIDAVIVATPDWMHAEHANACMRAGKHVYCEKEMSNSLEKAKSMVTTQRDTGMMLQIGHQRRSNPRYIHAINNVIRGANMLGRVTHAYAQWNRAVADFIPPAKKTNLNVPQDTLDRYGYANMEQLLNWRWFSKYGGGPMVDLGSHHIDIFFWVWDCVPISVTAIGGSDYYNREMNDNVMAMYEFKTKEGKINRAYYQVLTTTSSGSFHEKFMGEDGTLNLAEISSRGNNVERETREGVPDWDQFIKQGLIRPLAKKPPAVAVTSNVAVDARVTPPPPGYPLPIELNKPAHMPHLENFFAAVRRNKPEMLNCNAQVAYESAVAVLAANVSVKERKTIYFEPTDFHV
ncbi:MAG: Gfo/Idh/MocA family oxidoreductase [Kiritimatiellaeota bacterium]|nr:Gfo/Idh/MocA family oxidoreductase [Kiritimatiellota bacterium]